ncbi:MAG: hypothetical protein JO135_09250 [Candidatus Eremiobacteraeota bacterium]|nr:hypothetical protein [Candidatus Eremiobacteraeota bacterium]
MIAVCALLISAVAAGASVYQTRVISQQNRLISEQFGATTWPYLSFANAYSANFVEVDLRNNGVGPAIIRSAEITLDGKAVGPGKTDSAIDSVVETAVNQAQEDTRKYRVQHPNGPRTQLRTSTTSLSTGDVVPAGANWVLVRADGPYIAPRVVALHPRINIKLCYCSLVGRCWTKEYVEAKAIPRDVPGCPAAKQSG